jgi:hypothetical protein
MRGWFLATAFAVLASAEIALGPLLVTSGGSGPDLLLVLAVFLALRVPRGLHPFFYLGLGTFSDLMAVPRPGLRGFGYVVAVMVVELINPGRMRRNPLALGVLCTLAGLIVELTYLTVAALHWPGGPGAALGVALRGALLTGLAGLLLAWPVDLTARLFGWPPAGAPLSWSQLMAAAASGAPRPADRGKG